VGRDSSGSGYGSVVESYETIMYLGFYKIRIIYLLTELLLASQGGLRSMALVSVWVKNIFFDEVS
jgi:hypothetical protein